MELNIWVRAQVLRAQHEKKTSKQVNLSAENGCRPIDSRVSSYDIYSKNAARDT